MVVRSSSGYVIKQSTIVDKYHLDGIKMHILSNGLTHEYEISINSISSVDWGDGNGIEIIWPKGSISLVSKGDNASQQELVVLRERLLAARSGNCIIRPEATPKSTTFSTTNYESRTNAILNASNIATSEPSQFLTWRWFDKAPWWTCSPIQGLLSGILIAQGGYNAGLLLLVSPLIDIAGWKRLVKLRYTQIGSSRPSKAVILACLGLNFISAALVAAVAAPFSPWAGGTQRFFHKIMALPTSYSSYQAILSGLDLLRTPAQQRWLHADQINSLEVKQKTALNIYLKDIARQLERYDVSRKISAWENFPPSLLARLNPADLSDKALQGASFASYEWMGRTRSEEESDINSSNQSRFGAESSRREEIFDNSKEGKALAARIANGESKAESTRLREEVAESGVAPERIGVIQDLKGVRAQIADKFLSKDFHGPEAAELAKQMMREKSIAALLGAGASKEEAQRGWNYISDGIDANLNY